MRYRFASNTFVAWKEHSLAVGTCFANRLFNSETRINMWKNMTMQHLSSDFLCFCFSFFLPRGNKKKQKEFKWMGLYKSINSKASSNKKKKKPASQNLSSKI